VCGIGRYGGKRTGLSVWVELVWFVGVDQELEWIVRIGMDRRNGYEDGLVCQFGRDGRQLTGVVGMRPGMIRIVRKGSVMDWFVSRGRGFVSSWSGMSQTWRIGLVRREGTD
jgi:membrane peptidoglycan carboxypeptidase